jgi:hypothetical protein
VGRVIAAVSCVALLATCSSDDKAPANGASSGTGSSASASATTQPAPQAGYEDIVRALADDAMDGRDNQTPGSAKAQEYLVARLREIAEPLAQDFREPFAEGTNLLGLIRGSELPDEYVILGAHYDHLGHRCRMTKPGDDICNGATDNAASVAAVLEIGRRLAEGERPRRSIVIALWDAEEDGLLGSTAYISNPAVPKDHTVAYLNWDNQGSNLLPSTRNTTIQVGAETGGSALVDLAAGAAAQSDLDTLALSLVFGQGRSDHAVFADAGIPVVFSTDATSGCYHTVQDDVAAVDFTKLGREIDKGEALARAVADAATAPRYVAGTPPATFEDARAMLAVLRRGEPDLTRFPPDVKPALDTYLADVQAMVDAGPGAFDGDAIATLLGGAIQLVDALTKLPCDAFIG